MLQIPLWKRVVILGICCLGIAFSFPNLFYNSVETHNDAAAEIEALGTSPEREVALNAWPSALPSSLSLIHI